MNKGIFAIFFVVAVLSISFPVNAQKTAQRVGEGYTSEGIYYEVYAVEDLEGNDIALYGSGGGATARVDISVNEQPTAAFLHVRGVHQVSVSQLPSGYWMDITEWTR